MHEVRPARVFLWLDHLGACAVERDSPWPGTARPPIRKSNYVKIIYYAQDRGDNTGQATEGSTVSSIKCDRCWHFDLQRHGASRGSWLK